MYESVARQERYDERAVGLASRPRCRKTLVEVGLDVRDNWRATLMLASVEEVKLP